MRLSELRMDHFRRFVKARVDLSGDVVALVGPNEAGKSSVLEALHSIESEDPFEKAQLTDRDDLDDDDHVVVEVRYALDDEEARFALEFGATNEPRWFVASKRRDGTLSYRTDPKVRRDVTARMEAVERLGRLLNNSRLKSLLDQQLSTPRPGDEPDDERTLRKRLSELRTALDSEAEMLSRATRSEIAEGARLMADCVEDVGSQDRASVQSSVERLRDLEATEARTPHNRMCEQLRQRRPQLLLFGDDHRYLRDEYELSQLSNNQLALANLMSVGGTTPQRVKALMESGDAGKRRGVEERANGLLEREFTEAWGQSGVYPRLDFDDERLRVFVPSPRTRFSPIAERSDGLRAFVALFSFTHAHGSGATPPILLIDEAERHLHYDAQADLVSMFYKQQAASQIIYTTHSAGCLPFDLGTGVRVVSPISRENSARDSGRSKLHNHFWGSDAGFTPLMLAMGASALAFAPTRRAVIGEGATEMFLLPSLFREVAPDDELQFQVAPGLANVSEAQMRELDFEAPRVAYLVDGDKAGRKIQARLQKAEVDADRILSLPSRMTCEDLVAPDLYAHAVNAQLKASGHTVTIDAQRVPKRGRTKWMAETCTDAGVDQPKKVAVARRILQIRGERNIVDPRNTAALERILEGVNTALGLNPPEP